MKRDSIEDLSYDFDDGVEEIDLTEGARYKRAFKKFYYQQKKNRMLDEVENDCEDIEGQEEEEEIEEMDLDIHEPDVELEEEDLE